MDNSAAAPTNKELFDSGIKALRDAVPMWATQLTLVLGHSVDLAVDWNSLEGQYASLQPFVRQVVTGTIEALTHLAFDPAIPGRLAAAVKRVVIRASAGGNGAGHVELSNGTLIVDGPLASDAMPPTAQIAAAIRGILADGPSGADFEPLRPESPSAADSAAPSAAPPGDPYARAAQFMIRLEKALRDGGIWPGDQPPGPLEVKGAFGCENLAYEQWLAWVLMPRVAEIVAERGEFPQGSATATYAIRCGMDGAPGGSDIVRVLSEFDAMVDELSEMPPP